MKGPDVADPQEALRQLFSSPLALEKTSTKGDLAVDTWSNDMATKLAHFIGKTIPVAVPSLFGDDRPRFCKLLEIELCGLWLQSDELVDRMEPGHGELRECTRLAVFVPYCQIGYILQVVELGTAARKTAVANAVGNAARENTHDKPLTERPRRDSEAKLGKKGIKPKRGE